MTYRRDGGVLRACAFDARVQFVTAPERSICDRLRDEGPNPPDLEYCTRLIIGPHGRFETGVAAAANERMTLNIGVTFRVARAGQGFHDGREKFTIQWKLMGAKKKKEFI